jgi:hypothetical protein
VRPLKPLADLHTGQGNQLAKGRIAVSLRVVAQLDMPAFKLQVARLLTGIF